MKQLLALAIVMTVVVAVMLNAMDTAPQNALETFIVCLVIGAIVLAAVDLVSPTAVKKPLSKTHDQGKVRCPSCKARLFVDHPGKILCPGCGKTLTIEMD